MGRDTALEDRRDHGCIGHLLIDIGVSLSVPREVEDILRRSPVIAIGELFCP